MVKNRGGGRKGLREEEEDWEYWEKKEKEKKREKRNFLSVQAYTCNPTHANEYTW